MNRTLFIPLIAVLCVAGFLAGRAAAQQCSTDHLCGAGVCNGYDGAFMGAKKDSRCDPSSECPTGYDQQGRQLCNSGNCRTEFCYTCPGQTGTISAYQCQNLLACQDKTITSLCLNNCP